MKKIIIILLVSLSSIWAQSFDIEADGTQLFNFADSQNRNQASFFSKMEYENIKGTADDFSGTVSFDPADFAGTLKGKLSVKVKSMKTGNPLRNDHLKGENWLYAEKYPDISFEIVKVINVEKLSANKLLVKLEGKFTMRGVTNNITATAEVTWLKESEATRKRAPGDLLGVKADFDVKLSEYNVENDVIGSKVAEYIKVEFNAIASKK